MSYSNSFSLLKQKFIKEWELYINHQFVKKLSNDSLDEKKFLNLVKVCTTFIF